MPRKTKPFYTISEAAAKLRISRQAVHDAIKAGRLEAEKGDIRQTKLVVTVIQGWKVSPTSVAKFKVDIPRRTAGKKSLIDA
jgi:predicted transcriptional regulator